MTDVKCIRCGVLTIPANQICQICEIELNPIRPSSTGSGFLPSPKSSLDSKSDSATIRPFYGIGDLLGPTFTLFAGHFWLIAKLSIVIFAPFEVFKALSIADVDYEWQLSAGILLLDLLCTVLVAPALVYALMQVMQTGVAPGINESYRWGISKVGKLAICAAISGILSGLGFMLCIIPGLVLSMALFLVFPIAILEKGSPMQVIQGSCELTKGHRWNILGASFVVFLLTVVISVPVEYIGVYLGSRQFALWPLNAAAAIFGDIMYQSTVVLSLVTYLSIRALWSQSTQ